MLIKIDYNSQVIMGFICIAFVFFVYFIGQTKATQQSRPKQLIKSKGVRIDCLWILVISYRGRGILNFKLFKMLLIKPRSLKK